MDDDFVDPNEHYGDDDQAAGNQSRLNSKGDDDQLYRTVGYIALACALIAGSYSYFDGWFGLSNTPQESAISHSPQPVKKPTPSGLVAEKVEELTGLPVSGADSFDWATEEEIAANRSAVADFRSKLDEISRSSNANAEALVLLRSKIDGLRTSEAGAKLASKKELVLQYAALESEISKLKASSTSVDNFVNDMKALLKRVENAKDTRYSPQNFVVDRASAFLAEGEEKAAEIKRFDDAVAQLIEKGRELAPGIILETALREQETVEEEDLAEKLVKARQEAKARANEKLAEAERKRIESENEVKVAKLAAETSKNKNLARQIGNDIRDQEAARVKALAKQKLEREFAAAGAEIQTYLIYLTADGRSNRGAATGAGPVSYSAVVSSGALVPGDDGIIAMSTWCGSNGRWNRKNSRADKSKIIIFSPATIAEARYEPQIQYLEKAQELLKKFGPLMVEKGLLAE